MQRLRERFRAYVSSLRQAFQNYQQNLNQQSSTRFLTFAWSCAISFVAFFLLAAFPPVYLLLPGALYPAPRADLRVALPVATFTHGGKPVLVDRFIHPDYSAEERIKLMAHFISQLPSPGEYPANMPDLMPLPHLGLAIRKVWKTENGVVIDLRRKTIDTEVDVFLKSHATKKKSEVLDAWFQAFTAGILQQYPGSYVEYRLDGEVEELEDLDFALDRRHLKP
ncbi:MAG: hypothetical protein HS115_15460 [Spirochaetales bacterium]|nr:hypothetical protein [Spirochaetales bacterium]